MDNDFEQLAAFRRHRENETPMDRTDNFTGWLDKSIATAKAQAKARREHVYTHAEIEALLAQITEGDWIACHDGECSCGQIYGGTGELAGCVLVHRATTNEDEDIVPADEQQKANARFISRAPTVIRQLLAERALLINAHKIFMSRRMQYEFQMIDQWQDTDIVEEFAGIQLTVADMKRLRDILATIERTDATDTEGGDQ